MFAITHPTTREYSHAHFSAAAARIEADALSDRRELDYLLSSGDQPDFEALDAVSSNVIQRFFDRFDLLTEIDVRDDII